MSTSEFTFLVCSVRGNFCYTAVKETWVTKLFFTLCLSKNSLFLFSFYWMIVYAALVLSTTLPMDSNEYLIIQIHI